MKQKGLSLVELLVGTTIAAIAGSLLISIMVQNNGVYYTQTTSIDQGVSLNDASAEVRESIRNASGIVVSYTQGQTTYTTNAQTLVATLPSLDSSNNVIDNTFDYLVIYQDTQKTNLLKKVIFPNAISTRKSEDKVLATKLSLISFSYLDSNNAPTTPVTASKINIVINLVTKNGTQSQTASSSSQINLRNN